MGLQDAQLAESFTACYASDIKNNNKEMNNLYFRIRQNKKESAYTGKAFLLYVSSCGLEEFSFPGISHYIPNRSMFYPQYEI